jgi:hypothetical protein
MGLSPFLPTLPPFIREVHRGCGGREITTRRSKKNKTPMGINKFFLFVFI